MSKIPSTRYIPLFVDLAGNSVLVIGGGAVGVRKVNALLRSGATVKVVAPQAKPQLRKWHRAQRLRWIERPVQVRDLNGAKLVICATGHPDVDRQMSLAARRRGLLVNCASNPELGNVIFPALARQGPVQIAVSTGGASPALTRKLARDVARDLGSKAARWARLIEQLRPLVMAQVPRQLRTALWKHLTADKLGDMLNDGRMAEARKFARMKIKEASQQIPLKRRTPSTK